MTRRTLLPLLAAAALAGLSGLSLARFPALVSGQNPTMEDRVRQFESRAIAVEYRQAELDARQADLDSRIAAFEGRLNATERMAGRSEPAPAPAPVVSVAAPAAVPAVAAPADALSSSRCTSFGAQGYTTQGRGGTSMSTQHNFQGVDGLMKIEVTTSEGDLITSWSIPGWLMDTYGNNVEAIMRDVERGILKDRGPLRCSP
jgi:hypothetical protein